MTDTFAFRADKFAQIKAPPPIVAGKRSGAAAIIANVNVLPFMPASNEIVHRLALQTPTRLLVTYFEAYDDVQVLEGYTLSLDGVDYPIRDMSRWPWKAGEKATYELVVEDLQNR